MRTRRNYLLSNADIILALLRAGYAHTCTRCERPIHVRHASGLCVWCFNGVADDHRPPLLPSAVVVRTVEAARRERPAAAPLEPVPAHY